MKSDRTRLSKMPEFPKTEAVHTGKLEKMPAFPKTGAVSTGLQIHKMPAFPMPPTAPKG